MYGWEANKRNQAEERNSAEDEPDDEGDLQITRQCEDCSGRREAMEPD